MCDCFLLAAVVTARPAVRCFATAVLVVPYSRVRERLCLCIPQVWDRGSVLFRYQFGGKYQEETTEQYSCPLCLQRCLNFKVRITTLLPRVQQHYESR